MMSTTFILPRSGDSPLRFDGELIAASDGRFFEDKEQSRYHVIEIYRTQTGMYALWISYVSTWKNKHRAEVGHDYSAVFSLPGHVASALRDYNPISHVQGFPPGQKWKERQERLLQDVRQRFESQVSAVLDNELFAETV